MVYNKHAMFYVRCVIPDIEIRHCARLWKKYNYSRTKFLI